MAYEVLKTIGGRQYRYRVQSERDAQTGKVRNRWTYLGRVASETGTAKTRVARPNARQRLLEAAERLLESGDATALTVDAIATAAGVAHGTFYRYFVDRSSALEALARYIKQTRAIGDPNALDDEVATIAAARAGVRDWVIARLRYARERRGAFLAWHALIASDARLSAFREERRDEMHARVRAHVAALAARGFTDVSDASATAGALIALIEGVIRASVLERDRLDDAAIEAVAQIAERALFAGTPR